MRCAKHSGSGAMTPDPWARSEPPGPGADHGYLPTATVTPPPMLPPPPGGSPVPGRSRRGDARPFVIAAAAACLAIAAAAALTVALLPGNAPKPAATVHHPVAAPGAR